MKIGFIGAGKVGFSLGRYLKEKGIHIAGYYSQSVSSSKDAAAFTNSKAFKKIIDLIEVSDLIFVTTPDDKISSVWQQIREFNIEDKIICHCSGSLVSTIFEESKKYKAYVYAVHPLYAISSKEESYKQLGQAYFSLEGDLEKMYVIEALFKKLGNPYQIISAEHKSLYHAAAVTVSNQVIGLLNQGVALMKQCGFEDEMALKALWPLIGGNIENVEHKGLINALTGPVERGDIETIKKHLNVLNDEDKKLYSLLSLKTLEVAQEKHPEKNYKLLMDCFKREI
ncbi:Rossmann-like and DUF2520 domain-containing protein [Cellulosilyticum ruminicola]|uniref:Rossmann-like and DUF2520 domain-containing protein n=1 Tax=Cellulosilyticum ruminicola TaxID=425254 RepID=UPI0006D05BE8|nr:Rossmann-like and DUF2520 domain-containing protein [Cellulosilyticum ruminicola]